MSAHEGLALASPYATTLISRIRTVSRETFWRRLLLWSTAVCVAAVVVRLLMPAGVRMPDKGALALSFAIGGCAGFGACVYCFARFILCRELCYLLGSAAFSALGGGSALQAVADLRSHEPVLHCWIMTSAWLVSSVLFAGAAYSSSTCRRESRIEAIQQFVLGFITICAFPLAASPYAFDSNILYLLSASPKGALLGYVVDCVAGMISLVLLVFAILAYHRRFKTEGDRMAGLICYFLVPCAFGLLFRTASPERFDAWGHAGELVLLGAWLVLVAGVAVENAFAHKEATDRLQELESLHEVSWSLVGAGTLSQLLDLFVRTLVEKVGARIVAVYLADESREKLQLAAACGADELTAAVGRAYPLASESRFPGFHSGHTARAFASQETQIAEDVFIDVELVPWKVIAVDDGCAVSLPLVDQGRSTGVLDVYFSQRSHLTPQRLRLLATIAAATAPAIEHACVLQRESDLAKPQGTLDAAA